MDRDEKIARLDAWLDEYDHQKAFDMIRTFDKTQRLRGERMDREYEAVRHERARQTDKKIIEELGLFDE